ncbi:hypothetical protein JAAARDRAFT_196089 [Jaapia argillacea MUCL 33604]|uniref:Uncharacterized protein n=1 Tax=Jaapia argillacea MUCL 33604 TaxID=933084 RepID=A0A067PVD0_9AGAM|nr:hypothetical protein JAAARDRAFT_196089 [Jaapia argillacea MUCL 33604]
MRNSTGLRVTQWRSPVPLRPRDMMVLLVPPPSPIQDWVEAAERAFISNTRFLLTLSQERLLWHLAAAVVCTVSATTTQGEIDGFFVDPNTYTLHLEVEIPSQLHSKPSVHKLILQEFVGHSSEYDLPGWTARTSLPPLQFALSAENFAHFACAHITDTWVLSWATNFLDQQPPDVDLKSDSDPLIAQLERFRVDAVEKTLGADNFTELFDCRVNGFAGQFSTRVTVSNSCLPPALGSFSYVHATTLLAHDRRLESHRPVVNPLTSTLAAPSPSNQASTSKTPSHNGPFGTWHFQETPESVAGFSPFLPQTQALPQTNIVSTPIPSSASGSHPPHVHNPEFVAPDPTIVYHLPDSPPVMADSQDAFPPSDGPRNQPFGNGEDDALWVPDHRDHFGDELVDMFQDFLQIGADDWEDPDEADNDAPPPPPPLLPSPSPLHATTTPVIKEQTTFSPVLDILPDSNGPPQTVLGMSPDPAACNEYYVDPGPTRSTHTAADIHPNPLVHIVYLLVLWLHSQFHLPFRACTVILTTFAVVVHACGVILDPPMFNSLPRIISALGAESSFQQLPVCPECLEVYPITVAKDACCNKCQHPLFIMDPTPADRRSGKTTRTSSKPHLRFPTKSLQEQLTEMLPPIEDELDLWRRRPHVPNEYTTIFDGKIVRELPGADSLPFFHPDMEEMPNGELRIGLTLGVDWFSYLRSQIAPSHTSCLISFSVINLLDYLRYRTSNLLLAGIMPGPKEADPDQCQKFMRVFVNELIWLWYHGFKLITPWYPDGRWVRVALVGILCDKPAAHKMGGFGSHSHTFFCTRCWISQALKATAATFTSGGFLPRSDAQHRSYMNSYLGCKSANARAEFVKKFATRVVKSHFYHIWVQLKVLRRTKELCRLHSILAEVRHSTVICEPAGGSLTADQWRNLVLVVGPLAIPQIWDEFLSETNASNITRRLDAIGKTIADNKQKKQAAAAARKAASTAKKTNEISTPVVAPNSEPRRSGRSRRPTARVQEMAERDEMEVDEGDDRDDGEIHGEQDDDNDPDASQPSRKQRRPGGKTGEDDDSNVPCNLSARDSENFAKLSEAMKILVSNKITETDLCKADNLIRAYCLELVELYGSAVIQPNHHYATHTAEFVRDYGPLKEFWTFLFERINKVLKSYRTPNHTGGELECSFFREFHRTVQTSRLLSDGSKAPAKSDIRLVVDAMYKASADNRGTVQALARDLDEAREDGGVALALSPRSERCRMPMELYYLFLQHLQDRHPTQNFRSHAAIVTTNSESTMAVTDQVQSPNRANSLVAVQTSPSGSIHIGELLDIVVFQQDGIRKETFGRVRWFKRALLSIDEMPWRPFKALQLNLWEADAFIQKDDDGPHSLIMLETLMSPVVCHTVAIREMKYWLTIVLERLEPEFSNVH